MKVTTKFPSDTQAVLTVVAEASELAKIKKIVLKHLAPKVKLAGFRDGKAPLELIEKNIDQSTLQTEFLDRAINELYPLAVQRTDIRPVDRPEVNLKKFVPFSTLEFEAEIPVVSKIELPDYKKIKKVRKVVSITAKEVDEVIDSLRKRQAEKKEVDRTAKSGDEVIIDFKGVDDKGKPVNGADGKDYPLSLGSGTFIPGFEDNVIGMKSGDEKTFTLKFPKDYGVKVLASRDVTFTVTIKKIQEVVMPELDDKFAASVGPVKSVAELKGDIKKELQLERQRQADRDFESELLQEITSKSKLSVPKVIIDDQIERMFKELQQNLMYRGQTVKEFLDMQGKTEEQYRTEDLAVKAEERVRGSLVLAEIADLEKVEITPEELEIRIQALKTQYQDPQMLAELDKPENRRDIASRMMSEKVMAMVASHATKS